MSKNGGLFALECQLLLNANRAIFKYIVEEQSENLEVDSGDI